MTPEAKERIQLALDAGCKTWGERCGGTVATLCRRRINAAVTVHLQCCGCGRSLIGAIARAQVYGWQDLPEWDQARADEFDNQMECERQMLVAAADDRRAAKEQERARYHEWCRTSPQWHHLSGRVMWRSRGICEACLDAPAQVVHHLTYDYGKLPPAWHLRAVCNTCHDRFHANKRGEEDEWCLSLWGAGC